MTKTITREAVVAKMQALQTQLNSFQPAETATVQKDIIELLRMVYLQQGGDAKVAADIFQASKNLQAVVETLEKRVNAHKPLFGFITTSKSKVALHHGKKYITQYNSKCSPPTQELK